jgi:16S rRNA G966 N2-methylase RsmD
VAKNLRMLGFTDRGRVIEKEALAALRFLEKTEPPFHLVFIDPPYRQGLAERILEYLAASTLINENSLVVVEVSSDEILPTVFDNLKEFDKRIYGDTAIAFFRRTL